MFGLQWFLIFPNSIPAFLFIYLFARWVQFKVKVSTAYSLLWLWICSSASSRRKRVHFWVPWCHKRQEYNSHRFWNAIQSYGHGTIQGAVIQFQWWQLLCSSHWAPLINQPNSESFKVSFQLVLGKKRDSLELKDILFRNTNSSIFSL